MADAAKIWDDLRAIREEHRSIRDHIILDLACSLDFLSQVFVFELFFLFTDQRMVGSLQATGHDTHQVSDPFSGDSHLLPEGLTWDDEHS